MSAGQPAPVLIGGAWRPAAAQGTFRAADPATGQPLPAVYPISGRADLLAALEAGAGAADQLRTADPAAIAGFLEDFAARIEASRAELVALAAQETALPAEPRLNSVELPRTANQLRLAAGAARERDWTCPVIDTQADIRSWRAPLGGPVAIFGPNNFPFAFNAAAGGDFAAAIASHNPVIAKAHPGHPGTTRLLAELAHAALLAADLPAATLQLIYHLPAELGLELVAHPLLGATAFTGSREAGLRLKAAADQAGRPLYAELSGVNPVFVLPGALAERAEQIAADFAASALLGGGQFCTNPGLLVVPGGPAGERFAALVAEHFAAAPPAVVLGDGVAANWRSAVALLREHGAQPANEDQIDINDQGSVCAPTLLSVAGSRFLRQAAALQAEAFGPASLLVLAGDSDELLSIAGALGSGLAGSIYSHAGGDDDAVYARLEPLVRRRVGRLLNDTMPTGVAVSAAMVHGGPYPASGHAGFTSVGIPAALQRFTALQAYDRVRQERLPPELRDANPTGRLWRMIDGAWTQADAARK